MGLFIGSYDCTLDAKNRLLIPADFRREVEKPGVTGPANARGRAWGPPTRWQAVLYVRNRLQLMPEEEFEKWVANIQRKLLPSNEQIEFVRKLYSRSHRIEPDRQGRILLPEWMLKMAGLGREVTLSGQGQVIEVLDRTAWEAEQRSDNFDELFEKARAAGIESNAGKSE